MYAEITKEVFELLKGECIAMEVKETYRKEFYSSCDDTQLMLLRNYNGTLEQYFIRDINA